METIGSRKLRSYLGAPGAPVADSRSGLCEVTPAAIRKDVGCTVDNYLDLAEKVARIQYHNPDFVFLYRGQGRDHIWRGASTLKPSIFRLENSKLPTPAVLRRRFDLLRRAEALLVEHYPLKEGSKKIRRQRLLRWAVLQHYAICDTPLLDVTHSLRVAVSFAAYKNPEDAFIYMLGLPNLGASVTASVEAGLQIVRLSSACPPEARRPHLQEGYLIGEYPEISDLDQNGHYEPSEVDFGRRLVAKFRFKPQPFRAASEEFPLLSRPALYASQFDPMVPARDRIKSLLESGG